MRSITVADLSCGWRHEARPRSSVGGARTARFRWRLDPTVGRTGGRATLLGGRFPGASWPLRRRAPGVATPRFDMGRAGCLRDAGTAWRRRPARRAVGGLPTPERG